MMVEMFVKHIIPFCLIQFAKRMRFFLVKIAFSQLLSLRDIINQSIFSYSKSFCSVMIKAGAVFKLCLYRTSFTTKFFTNDFRKNLSKKLGLGAYPHKPIRMSHSNGRAFALRSFVPIKVVSPSEVD
jgi:hypothetical protein